MKRYVPKQDLESGQDSFLDVVSNIVGILIILVVIVGAQVKSGLTSSKMREIRNVSASESRENASRLEPENESEVENDSNVAAETAPETELESELNADSELDLKSEPESDTQTAADSSKTNLQHEKLTDSLNQTAEALQETMGKMEETQRQIADFQLQKQRMDAEQVVFEGECVQIETRLRLVRQEMETFTDAKDVENREKLLLAQESVTCDRSLEELESRLQLLENQKKSNGGPKKIEHKETPIIHSVDGNEFHFIVDKGRILYIPMEVLLKDFERRLPSMVPTLVQNRVRTEVLGPYDGFRMSAEVRLNEGGRVGVRWHLIPPEMEESAETIQEALAPGSKFLYTLEKIHPEKDIVTFWIYPDGFPSLPTLKEAVYRLGFSIAFRPLPAGMPISGSPEGQKSVSQ